MAQLRRLRDEHLLTKPNGREFAQMLNLGGQIPDAEIGKQPDADRLRGKIGDFLVSSFDPSVDMRTRARSMAKPIRKLERLVEAMRKRGGPTELPRLMVRAIQFVRDELMDGMDFDEAMNAISAVIDDEGKTISRRIDGPPGFCTRVGCFSLD